HLHTQASQETVCDSVGQDGVADEFTLAVLLEDGVDVVEHRLLGGDVLAPDAVQDHAQDNQIGAGFREREWVEGVTGVQGGLVAGQAGRSSVQRTGVAAEKMQVKGVRCEAVQEEPRTGTDVQYGQAGAECSLVEAGGVRPPAFPQPGVSAVDDEKVVERGHLPPGPQAGFEGDIDPGGGGGVQGAVWHGKAPGGGEGADGDGGAQPCMAAAWERAARAVSGSESHCAWRRGSSRSPRNRSAIFWYLVAAPSTSLR